jgi:hypothetical protein
MGAVGENKYRGRCVEGRLADERGGVDARVRLDQCDDSAQVAAHNGGEERRLTTLKLGGGLALAVHIFTLRCGSPSSRKGMEKAIRVMGSR